jgi:nitrate/nitrite-specific signal transduction histidine kinase
LSLFTILGLEKYIIKHIRTLHKGTEIISQTGDLNYEIMIDTRDEVGALAASFNQMTKDLIKNIDKLTEETRVREKYESELKIAHDSQMSFLPQIFRPSQIGQSLISMRLFNRPGKWEATYTIFISSMIIIFVF